MVMFCFCFDLSPYLKSERKKAKKMLCQSVWVSTDGNLFFRMERDCLSAEDVDQMIIDTHIEFPNVPEDHQLIVCTSDSPLFVHAANSSDRPI